MRRLPYRKLFTSVDKRYAAPSSHDHHCFILRFNPVGLSAEFLSTPIGAALRPIIDGMSRSPGNPTAALSPQAIATATAASPNAALASSLLQTFASQYTAGRAPPTSGQ